MQRHSSHGGLTMQERKKLTDVTNLIKELEKMYYVLKKNKYKHALNETSNKLKY